VTTQIRVLTSNNTDHEGSVAVEGEGDPEGEGRDIGKKEGEYFAKIFEYGRKWKNTIKGK